MVPEKCIDVLDHGLVEFLIVLYMKTVRYICSEELKAGDFELWSLRNVSMY